MNVSNAVVSGDQQPKDVEVAPTLLTSPESNTKPTDETPPEGGKKKLKLQRSFSLGGEKSMTDGGVVEEVRLDEIVPVDKGSEGFGGDYIKSFVFGGLDGIVSTFALVAGLGGADVDIATLIAVSLAKILADAFSMGFGEYTSATAEAENTRRLRQAQGKAFDELPDGEAKEMIQCYCDKGMEQRDALTIVTLLMQYKELFLEHLLAFQYEIFGDEEEDKWQPLKQGLVCFTAFVLFGMVPLFGFIIFYAVDGGKNANQQTILGIAYGLTATTLFSMGFVKAKLTGSGTALRSGILMVVNGTIAGGAAYGIGEILAEAMGN